MPVNKCFFLGNLTRKPELKTIPSGKVVVNFGLAMNERKDAPALFIDCEAWDKRAEFIHENITVGDQVEVEARLKIDSWTNEDGEKRKAHRYVVDNITPLKLKAWDKKGNQAASDDEDEAPAPATASKKAASSKKKSAAPPPPFDDDDDEDDSDLGF